MATPSQQQAAPQEQILRRKDFRLEQYIYPQWFFKRGPRPMRLIESAPRLTSYRNVIYTPTTSMTRPLNGCLYDEDRRRIDATCVWRGADDLCVSEEPLLFEESIEELDSIDQPVLYLGHISRHYGHFMLESLARWWPLAQQGPRPDRYLIHLADPNGLDIPLVKLCLASAGIKKEQLVFCNKPVLVKQALVPEASFQEASHIHVAYRDLWTHFLASTGESEANQTDQPLYVSRSQLRHGSSMYLGEEKIEAYLEGRGARIIHPQTLAVEEQIRLFNKHTRIIGIAGSATHNIMLSRLPKEVVYLTSPLVHGNHFLVDKCFQANSVFLQACRMSNYLRALSLRARARVKLASQTVAMSFWRMNQLDDRRVIDWFENSGYFN